MLPEAKMRMARFYYVLVAVEEPIEVAIDTPSGCPTHFLAPKFIDLLLGLHHRLYCTNPKLLRPINSHPGAVVSSMIGSRNILNR